MCFKTYQNHPINQKNVGGENLRAITVLKKRGAERHAQTVGDSTSSYKIDYVIVIQNFLNPKGHQNPIRQWFKSDGHFTEGVDFAFWWSFIAGGSAPAACAAGLFIYCSIIINRLGFAGAVLKHLHN